MDFKWCFPFPPFFQGTQWEGQEWEGLPWGISFHTPGWMALIMKGWLEVTLYPLVSSRHGVPQRMDSGILSGMKG